MEKRKYIITSGRKMGLCNMVDVYRGETHERHFNVRTMKQARQIVKTLRGEDRMA